MQFRNHVIAAGWLEVALELERSLDGGTDSQLDVVGWLLCSHLRSTLRFPGVTK
jgi:hypothetical protein